MSKQLAPTRQNSITTSMAERYGMEPQAFEQTLRNTIMKPEKNKEPPSQEEFAAFLVVAHEYNLNPLTKEIYAFPAKGGGVAPIVSVDGWANLINSNPQFDGMEFQDELDDNGAVIAITCRMFRKDRTRAISATEYMEECKRGTDPWRQWPRRMLRHKAMIQAARYAFGFSGIYEADEVERAFDAPERKSSGLAQRLEARRASPLVGPQEGYNAAAETIEGEILAATDETQAEYIADAHQQQTEGGEAQRQTGKAPQYSDLGRSQEDNEEMEGTRQQEQGISDNPLSQGATAIWSQLDPEARKSLDEDSKAILKLLMEDLAKVSNPKAAKNALTGHQKSIRAIGEQSFSELCQAAVTVRCAQLDGGK
ncbi:phage recombination protein Bet [Pseudovibrio sp. Ad26]|uniref:phage recombination protein Bet n=1 Tax=Pseudovibrio sp. Ad26 TaxID=989410 RepID=UPI0007AE67F0|nr:phage recombination protein Bet [Pseudovibrio sp. Ad26]KZL10669.1 RecT family protein [Pseudovibrio sp. Ad26]